MISKIETACLAVFACFFCALAVAANAVPAKPKPALDDPKVAAVWAAKMVGYESIGPALVKICERETGCRPWAEHDGDLSSATRETYDVQVDLGRIDPACQPWHPRRWGTGSPWGLSAVSHWAYMPPCFQPDELHDTRASAVVAARKYVTRCMPGAKTRSGWCGPREWLTR